MNIGDPDKIVGHKTMADGSHEPLYGSEANKIWEECERKKTKREQDMPTDADAIRTLFEAFQRLKELGWREAIYCPKDGSLFDAIECGSTGIHDCSYEGEWPKGSWFVHADNDLWPSHPVLFRLKSPTILTSKE